MAQAIEHNQATYAFDDVVVERGNFRVLKGRQARTLEPRAFDLLLYLIEHCGRVIEKEELFVHVWHRSFVTDSALTQAVRQIRRALGDSVEAPRYIETVPKRGYRFIATVTEARLNDAVLNGVSPQVSAPPLQVFDALAVLPFANLNTDPELDYFVEGITDLLITDLGKVKPLRVISRTSTMQYKGSPKPLPQIARELNVNAVVEGAVLRVGEQVRVTVQLIEAASDQHVWAECYERDLRDILGLQRELTETVAGKIRVSLTPAERARVAARQQVHPEAYEAYLKGNYLLSKFIPGGPQKAIELFRLALEKEPDYAAAHAALADAYGHLAYWGFVPPKDVELIIVEGNSRALALDDTLAEAHAGLARHKFYFELDYLAAEREFKRARSNSTPMTPAQARITHFVWRPGAFGRSIDRDQTTHELNPLSLAVSVIAGWHLFVLGRWDEAREEWRKTLELEPNFGLSHWLLWRVYRLQGEFDAALREFQSLALFYNSEVIKAANASLENADYQTAMRQAGETMAAQARHRYVPPLHIAMLFTHAEADDLALDWLERAHEARDPKLVNIGVEPDWKRLQPLPRFQQLLRRFPRAP